MNKHGGYYGDDQGKVIDFSVNINPLGVSTKVKDKIKETLDHIDRYPEIDGEGSRRIIGNYLNIESEEVILGNGAIELIYLFASAIKPKKVMIVQPTFNEYERAFNTVGSEIIHFQRDHENNFNLNIEDLASELEKQRPDALILCNPNNPTGSFIDVEEFHPILKLLKDIGAYLFLDESFIDFTNHRTYQHITKEYLVFIIRSMTKYFAIPGLRLGYGIGKKEVIDELNRHKAPWAVNSLALSIVPVVLKDNGYIAKTKEWYDQEKKFLWDGLNNITGIDVFPSSTNFYLMRIKDTLDIDLKRELLKRNIYIRDCMDFYGLGDGYFRIAVKNREDNKRLLEALEDIFE